MKKRLLPFFRHVMFNLRGGFLVRPLIYALVLGAIGAILSILEANYPWISRITPGFLFPTNSDPALCQVILSTIAGSMMTVVSIVFAILLMTLTLASMQYSPRILVAFAQDRVTQQTLGIFIGTFAYCIAALPAARSMPHPFGPVTTVSGAMLLALACVVCLLFFIHHISQAISVNHIVDRIALETEAIIDEMMPNPARSVRLAQPSDVARAETEAPVLSEISGYIRYIDAARLVAAAKIYKTVIRVVRRVGHFVPEGVAIVMVSKPDVLTAELCAEIRGSFDFGPTRTLQQDAEFGILQIVDIALKAISPAVNDPSTAINCIDHLGRILIRYGQRDPQECLLYDPPGVLRVIVPWQRFERMAESAFGQIRLYAQSDIAVSLRLMRALCDIAGAIPTASDKRLLVEHGQRILAGCAKALPDEDLREMRDRMETLERIAGRPSPEKPRLSLEQ
jgi:uncharacterized membrane protein